MHVSSNQQQNHHHPNRSRDCQKKPTSSIARCNRRAPTTTSSEDELGLGSNSEESPPQLKQPPKLKPTDAVAHRQSSASQNSKPRAATRKPEGKAKAVTKHHSKTRRYKGPPPPKNINFEHCDDEVLSKVTKKKKRHSKAIVSEKCVGMILFNVVFLI